MIRQRPLLVEALTAVGADRRAVRAAASRFLAGHRQPHPGLGPVRHRLRHPVRLYRPAVVRPVGLLRHRRHGRRLSAHRPEFSLRHDGGVPRHDRGGGRRLSGRADRAAAHRHLFRHDHGGDRGGVLLHRIQSAVGLYRRRERPAGRADPELSISASPPSTSTPTGRSMSCWRSGISSAS